MCKKYLHLNKNIILIYSSTYSKLVYTNLFVYKIILFCVLLIFTVLDFLVAQIYCFI